MSPRRAFGRCFFAALFPLFCMGITGPAWSQAARRKVQVSLSPDRTFAPGADAPFYFSLPGKKVEFTLLRADAEKLVQVMVRQSGDVVDLSDATVVRTWTESADAANPQNFNRNVTVKVPEPGVYVLEARYGAEEGSVQYQSFFSSEIALVLKRGAAKMAAWVVDRATGQPRGNALVHARFPTGPLVEARANADGLALLTLSSPEQQTQFCAVTALAGKQWTLASTSTYGPQSASQDRAYCWMNRSLYAPGDHWQLRGIARGADGKPLAGARVGTKILDAARKTVHERSLKTDAYGIFEDSGALAEGLPSGAYSVQIQLGKQQTSLGFGLLASSAAGAGPLFDVRLKQVAGTGESDPTFALEARQRMGEPVRRGRVRYRAYGALQQYAPVPEAARYGWLLGDAPTAFQFWNPAAKGQTVTDETGAATLRMERSKLPTDQPYLLVATVTDRFGRGRESSLYVPSARSEARAAAAAPAPDPNAALSVTPDKQEYSLGEEARLTLKSGLNPTRALLTVEGDDLYRAEVVHLVKGEQQVRVPLADPRMRLLHVDLIALGPNAVQARATRLLFVDPARHDLRVTLTPRTLRQGEVEVEVETTDSHGRPVPARVMAGLEAQASGSFPRPYAWDARRGLYPAEADSVLTVGNAWGLYQNDLLPWLRNLGYSQASPGGTGSEPPAAESGQATASVVTDARGRGRLRLPYSGSLSELSLVARASARNGGVGQAELPLDAAAPVSVRLHVPSRLAVGDAVLARAEIRNRTDAPQTVTLLLSADGLELPGARRQAVQVPAQGRAWVDLPLKTLRPGKHSVRVAVEGAAKSRSEETASVTVADEAPVAGTLVPERVFKRVSLGNLGPVTTPLAGSVAPGDEVEVSLKLPLPAGQAGFRVVEPLSDGFALVKVDAPDGVQARQVERGIEFAWKEAPKAGETLGYRLRALSPGDWSLARTALYQGEQPLGGSAPFRLAVVDLPAPRLVLAEREGTALRLRYELQKRFPGVLSGTLAVRTRSAQGNTLAEAGQAVLFDAGSQAREVTVLLAAVEPEKVKGATVEAVLEGKGVLALGSAEVALPRLQASVQTGLTTALGQSMTRVLGQSELVAGAPASIRIITLNSRGATPLPGAAVRVLFQPKAEKTAPVLLAEGKTDASGTIDARFIVPEKPRGPGKLVVECSSGLGEERLERDAQIEDRLQMMLSTDKPLYQPGQRIHIRSLTLRKPDLIPLGKAPVTLEVSDPKGNKVFKQRTKTSAFGVAAAEFQLADEITMGSYVVRALVQPEGGEPLATEKTLEIKKYVLPRFKIEVSTERPFYLPGERLKGTMKVAYFFGKPVAAGNVELKLSTFVTKWEEIGQIKGKTNAHGEFTFEQVLPKMFVGQPLQAGNAVLMLEAAVTDTAEHRESRNHTVTVSANPINLSLIPESGTLAPNLENRVYVVANYPDGKPAKGARFRLSGPGLPDGGLQGQADAHGMAQVLMTPRPAGPGAVLKLQVEASDDQGNKTKEEVGIRTGERQDSVLLRTDQAIYEVGQAAKLEILSTGARGTVYLDVVRNRQTVLTQTIPIENGHGALTVPLGEDTAGTLEFRAYRILPNGEMARDTRIAYVNPANDLRIKVTPDKETYTPGSKASIGLDVTDKQGHPVMAALGVNIVDESVFALQELQPGLEKVYFTLEKELLEPRYEIHWDSPGMGVFDSAAGGRPEGERQALARVMFAAVEMAHDYSLAVNTQDDRAALARKAAEHLRDAVQNAVQGGQFNQERDAYFGKFHELPESREGLAFYAGENRPLKAAELRDPWDQPFRLELGELEPNQQFSFEVASAGPDGELDTEDDVRAEGTFNWWSYLTEKARLQAQNGQVPDNIQGILAFPQDSSLLFGGAKDERALRGRGMGPFTRTAGEWGMQQNFFAFDDRAVKKDGMARGFGGGGFAGPEGALRFRGDVDRLAAPAPLAAQARELAEADRDVKAADKPVNAATAPGAGEPAVQPARVREYFPETLYSNPALVTDAGGKARIDLDTADSITTWRITALANSRAGGLGSVSAPMRVFQDFFVDLDLPVSLTQGDEVQLPVAVYNYLPASQRVRLRLQLGDEDKDGAKPWFEMVGGDAIEKFATLEKDQVSVVTFRIRAKNPGVHRFTVMAYGSKMSDAVRRQVEVTPDGKEVRSTVNDRLEKSVSTSITIPENAIPGSAKVLVKVYPGIFSQVVEGLDGMFRMPTGCFEQTTSATYPNVLVMDYLKKSKKISPEVQMKAEEYINIGYQKLLTFQAADGGFSLWAGGQPETFLTAFGLMEAWDMSKVHEVDPAVIGRVQAWLMSKQNADGSWPVSPSAHQERASASGVYAFTAYATWALSETSQGGRPGAPAPPQGLTDTIKKGVQYLKDHLDDAKDTYTLALVANALATVDPQDAVARRVVQTLAEKAQEDEKSAWWSNQQATTFTIAQGKSADLETTGLAACALIRSRSHGALVTKALTYLIRSKDSFGTWSSTQATTLALKALIASMGASLEDNQGTVTVLINGKEAQKLSINAENSDVLQQVDLGEGTQPGVNQVELKVEGKLSALYQVVGRYYLPWNQVAAEPREKGPLSIQVEYDKTDLKTDDTLTAKVKVENVGERTTGQVVVDLGIPPGFQVLAEDLAEARGSGMIQRFDITGRQVILYVEAIQPRKPVQLSYRLRAKFPVRAKTPRSMAYDYYSPDLQAIAKPVELTVR
jgi:uncharacterized protein YfaS (alpha-2-macroglobulin family)